METKINGVPSGKILRVYFAPEAQPGSNNRRYEGTIRAAYNDLMNLMDQNPFTLEYEGVTYKMCRVEDPSAGSFNYLSKLKTIYTEEITDV